MRMKLEHKKILTFIAPIALIAVFLVPTQFASAGLLASLNPVNWLLYVVSEIWYFITVGIGTIILTVGGSALDLTVYWFIVEMGDWFAAPGADLTGSVAAGWTLVRDLLNMGFIFGLVYIGIKTILNSEDSGTRRALGYLIAAALLINFSLLITQVIIDFSNLLGAQIYAQLDAAGGGDDSLTMPITSAFLNSLGLTALIGSSPNSLGGGISGLLSSLATGTMIMVFFSIAGLVFALGSVMVTTRFIALTFYMMFSPLMFIGWILPQFQSVASKWWKGFFKYVWFGPLFLLLIYLSAAITQDLSATLGVGGFADYADSPEFDGGLMETILLFSIAMGLIWGSLKIGEKMSISGSKLVMNGLGAAQGVVYRNTAGRGLDYVRKGYDRIDEYAESEGDGSQRARLSRLGAKGLRTVAGGEAGRRTVVKARDYGAGGTGWAESEKMDTERTARATRNININRIKANIPEQIHTASGAQLVEMMQDPTLRPQVLQNIHRLNDGQIKAMTGSDKLNDKVQGEIATAATRSLKPTDQGGANINVKDLSKEHVNLLGAEELSKPENAVNLKPKDIDGLNLSKEQKEQIKQARKDGLAEVAKGKEVGGMTPEKLAKTSASDIGDLPDEVFGDNQFTKDLSVAALKQIADKKSPAVQKNIRKVLEDTHMEAMTDPKGDPRGKSLQDFLENDRVGRGFGVN